MSPHLATRMGVPKDPAFVEAYWLAFEETFGTAEAPAIRAMILSRHARGDRGTTEVDRVCFGLRQLHPHRADQVEHRALEHLSRRPSGRA